MAGMQYTKIPYVDKKVSRIFYGTACSPFMTGEGGDELLDAAFAAGINAFDTARVYNLSESTLGKWLEERGIRDQAVILSKCGHPDMFGRKRIKEKEIRKDLTKSLQSLRTDHIDIYLLHRDDPGTEAGGIVELLNALHAEGKIGAFGGSNWTHQRIEEANEYAYKHDLIPFTVSSPNFGLAEQAGDPWGGGCVSISGPDNEEAREWYRRNQMPVIAYSSLGRGLFSGRVKGNEPQKASGIMDEAAMKGYGCADNFKRLCRCEELAAGKHCTVPQIAMSWIFGQKLNAFAVVSARSPQRIADNIEALNLELSEAEAEYLDLKRETL